LPSPIFNNNSNSKNNRRNQSRRVLLALAGRALAGGVAASGRPPQRVLLLRPDHIGDVLLTAPAVALLRASLPRAELTYLVGPWSAEAARHGPAVDRVMTLAYPGFTRQPKRNALEPYATLLQVAARVRRARYDLAIVFRPDHWWGALLALAAGIPVRVGSQGPETAPLLTHACADDAAGTTGAAERALRVARLALEVTGVPPKSMASVRQFNVGSAARAEADAFWQRNGLGSRRVVGIQPSAGAPLKSWPISRWAALADALAGADQHVLLIGAPVDEPLLKAVRQRMSHAASLAYGQSLEASAALYERCAVLVTVDGGGGHLAAAVGTPTVRLYGPASAQVYGPWPARADQQVLGAHGLACVPCGHLQDPPCGARTSPACMLAIGVADVLQAVNLPLDGSS
jgi:heptosyltransferase-2/heptosyltransferase-3